MATSFEPPIRRMAVEAFRGFRDRQEFDLGATAVVVAGPNGTGKTSFFDALQWCLLGSIQRLEGLRARRNVEHIVNQYRLGDRAAVEMQLLIGGRSITLRRTGDHRSSTLEFEEDGGESVFGEDATLLLEEALALEGDLTLEMALTTSGLMQQDVMRAVLEARPQDRYRHISTVLGLAALEEFEAATRDLAAGAKGRADAARGDRDSLASSLSEAQTRLAAAEQRLQTLPQIEALRSETLALLSDAPQFVNLDSPTTLLDVSSARGLIATLGDLGDQLDALTAAWSDAEDSRRSLESEPSGDELEAARFAAEAAASAVVAKEGGQATIEARLASAQAASNDVARLAALAVPMLTDRCPVCGQSIDAADVERDLRSRAASSETMLALQSELDEARLAVQTAQSDAATAESRLRALNGLRQRWETFRANLRLAEAAFDRVVAPRSTISLRAPTASDLSADGARHSEFLRTLRRRVLEFLNTLEEGVDRGPVERAQSEVASFSEALEVRRADSRMSQIEPSASRLSPTRLWKHASRSLSSGSRLFNLL